MSYVCVEFMNMEKGKYKIFPDLIPGLHGKNPEKVMQNVSGCITFTFVNMQSVK